MILIWIFLLTFNQLPLNNTLRMISGKNPWKKHMMLSWRMACGSWWELHLEPNQLILIGSLKPSTNNIFHLKRTKWGLWKKYLHRKKVLIMRRLFPCGDHFIEWRLERECLHVSTRRFCCEGTRIESMQAHQILIWPETSTASLVWKSNWASSKIEFQAL
jgi:hypothetical protein